MKQVTEVKSEVWAMEHAARERAVVERIRKEVREFLAKRNPLIVRLETTAEPVARGEFENSPNVPLSPGQYSPVLES
ncbi:MAG: hypothetical protein K8S54_01240 [Spirochaetia bacterium]|nr:hypothetical protein [Spirochaetia bacterium]